jgi:hypothetical protein
MSQRTEDLYDSEHIDSNQQKNASNIPCYTISSSSSSESGWGNSQAQESVASGWNKSQAEESTGSHSGSGWVNSQAIESVYAVGSGYGDSSQASTLCTQDYSSQNTNPSQSSTDTINDWSYGTQTYPNAQTYPHVEITNTDMYNAIKFADQCAKDSSDKK